VHQHVAPYYLEESYAQTGIPNIVTVVLGSYRGFDTMGEAAVVVTALVGVLLLLARGGGNGHRSVDLSPGALTAERADNRGTGGQDWRARAKRKFEAKGKKEDGHG